MRIFEALFLGGLMHVDIGKVAKRFPIQNLFDSGRSRAGILGCIASFCA